MNIVVIVIFAIILIGMLVFGISMIGKNPKTQTTQQPPAQKDYSNVEFYPHGKEYFQKVDQIEAMWSVIQNLKAFSGDQADQLETACLDLIEMYKDMVDFEGKQGIASPNNCPGYVRLAMLYEKQGRYDEGVKLCAEAIQAGAYADNSNGKMYGRLARLIKKSGMQYDDDILKLTVGR